MKQISIARVAAADRRVRVGRYTLVDPGGDPADRLAETHTLVRRHGWQAPITTFDSTGMTDPAIRPQIARLYGAICRKEIDGIVAVSRIDISAFHSVYGDTLAAIRSRGGFLALVRSETTL
ncbi:hypothetical protein [Streptomyces spectabilis]|uniref:Resolvase/invertase-type recombinase catalytic domain-containing protein n=1 Tax=Streptomyces spectabilis TaxID=68270 RepID=A0A7W8B4C5_STRST|nr:hypothetical protein [Streptomyces spectabilis]MBB5108965.1 hypothetical protein [Streptomyces spectabilis]GGV50411.1 hypothetical protein GCM10010245_79360 [Streptomyces spectabilis]